MERMLDLGLYSKLAEVVLAQEDDTLSEQSQFRFTEKGALTAALEERLTR